MMLTNIEKNVSINTQPIYNFTADVLINDKINFSPPFELHKFLKMNLCAIRCQS